MEQFLNFLSMAGSFLFMVIFFGACVFFHELGHFLAGKWRGLHIDAFSIGFIKAWGKKINGIDYRIGYLPLGGYVELPQVDSSQDEIKAADGTILPRAKAFDRLVTAFAGPFFNILFGLILGCFVWYFGVPQDSPKVREFAVSNVEVNSPEYNAGLREGDIIISLNGKKFQSTWAEFAKDILLTVGEVTLEVKRGDEIKTITYAPKVNPNAPGNLKYEQIAYPFFEVNLPIEIFPIKGSSAEKAGLKAKDLLISVEGKKFNNYSDFFFYIATCGKEKLNFTVNRNGEIKNIQVPYNHITDTRHMMGFTYSNKGEAVILSLIADQPAEKAGLKVGDIIIKHNDTPIPDCKAFQDELVKDAKSPRKFTIKRAEEIL